MTRVCTVCQHPGRHAIDAALVTGTGTFRNIAERWGLSTTAVFRHRATCIPVALTKAQEAQEVANADDLLNQVRDLQNRTTNILAKAETAEDYNLALRAIGEARRNLELLARLMGELQEGAVVNIHTAPQWTELRGRILVALAPFPDARVALAEVLSERLSG